MKKKPKILSVSSVFPEGRDLIWEKLKKIETLQYIAFPFASFCPADKSKKFLWHEGNTYNFIFNLFCIIPFGIHKIKVLKFCDKDHEIYTKEKNSHVPIWNHRISLKYIDEKTSYYTDEVEIYAGWKTIFVFLWAKMFYLHRQKKWIRFLRKNN